MSWDELRDRLTQEARKRGDYALSRLGRVPGNDLEASLEPAGKFFFSREELRARVDLLRTHLPEEAKRLVRRANEIYGHRFSLLGYSTLEYGREIDWHLDAVHGKRAPLSAWYRIPFLDFSAVGDHKVTWELNRHQHLPVLAKAWLLSGETKYLDELFSQWKAWHEANPYPLGVNWASTLEVAFRTLSWIWVWELVRDAAQTPKTFARDVAQALRLNGQYIERYLSTYFSPNTHLLGEGFTLFFLGTLFPGFAEAERWRRKGWEIVEEATGRQVRPDGVYFEQSLYYHVYALDFFLHARVVAEANGQAVSERYDAVVRKMLEVVCRLSQAGTPQSFGDDDGGRLFDGSRNRAEHLRDALAVGAVLYGESEWRGLAQLTEESLWLYGERAVRELAGRKDRTTMNSAAFRDGGIYVLADSDQRSQMMLDAGPQGTGRCGHGHADALSVQFAASGRAVLVDSGAYVYMDEDGSRNLFRGTAAHNTLQVDERDQAEPAGPFAWDAIPQVKCERWISTDEFDFLQAQQDGYQRLTDPVLHRRVAFRAQGGPWLIRDQATGKQSHSLALHWHFAPEIALAEVQGGVRAELAGSAAVELLHAAEKDWERKVVRGNMSPCYGALEPAPMARFHTQISLPTECATLVVTDVASRRSFTQKSTEQAGCYTYETPEASHCYLFPRTSGVWEWAGWQSDAEFVYFHLSGSRLAHLTGIGGSFVKWQDCFVVRHAAPVGHFAWSDRNGRIEASSEDAKQLQALGAPLEVQASVR
jgi:hypothetical protein